MSRPPAGEALASFFSEAGVRNLLEADASWIDPDQRCAMVTYKLHCVQPLDLEACLQASTHGVDGVYASCSLK
eukprot:9626500-Lingulodinium_polyedra.AAC.1